MLIFFNIKRQKCTVYDNCKYFHIGKIYETFHLDPCFFGDIIDFNCGKY
jgi:hypothetical protein